VLACGWTVASASPDLLYRFEDCAVDTDRRELRRGRELVSVEPQVFDLLSHLIRNRERVVSRDDLIEVIWGGRIVSDSALTTRINAVRSAIGDNGHEQRLIKTIPRRGVRFVGEVHEQQGPDAPATAQTGARPTLALPERPSIAVLPFPNMSGDPEQEYFADGMTEEVITALSRCKWLFVIARNSSFTYKGKAVDVRQVGREFGVRYVLEGSVRRADKRLRFAGRLIDAASGTHIWSDRFEGDMTDVFALQDRFTESVVAAIEPRLQIAEIERLKQKPAANLDAYDLLLRAQQLEYEFSEASLAAALGHLKQALAIDPSYAPAMALAAYCYAGGSIQGWSQNLAVEASEGLRLASRALELGKDDGNVLWMAAYATRRLAQDVERARELAHRGLEINPNSAIAMAVAGWMEAELGHSTKALELLRHAQRLSPRDPRGWFMASGMALAHIVEGNFEEAAACARMAVDQNPRSTIALRFLAGSLAQLGQKEKAATALRQVLEIEPQLTLSRLQSRLLGIDEGVWSKVAEGLRLAGLPD
jgi:TolB-like protein/tetratricopeptide (TPR) repeat protein